MFHGIGYKFNATLVITFTKGNIALIEGSLGTNVDGDEGPELPIQLEILPAHLEVYQGTPDK